MSGYNILSYGAVGDDTTNNAAAIQAAINACHTAGGGRVLIPSGQRFRSGTIALKSDVELHVERGATLVASTDPADYPLQIVAGALAGGDLTDNAAALAMLITADRAERIAITGGGTIDGSGAQFVAEPGRYIHVMKPFRPFPVWLLGCRDVTIQDVTFRDAALWTVRLSGCEDVQVQTVRIHNDLKLPNSDGINFDRCRNVRVANCHIVAGDDCICIKNCVETAAWGGVSENVVVTGCTLVSTSSALMVGCEARETMRNIVFDSCVIQGSGRGLGLRLSEGANIENVIASNLVIETRLFHEKWWGRGEPICISAMPWDAERPCGTIKHVRISNVLARGENGVLIYGWQPGQIEDVVLEQVRIEIDRWTQWPGGLQDLRPSPGPELPALGTHGFLIHNASGVTLRNCEIVWGETRHSYYGHAVLAENAPGLTLDNFRGQAAHAEIEAVVRLT